MNQSSELHHAPEKVWRALTEPALLDHSVGGHIVWPLALAALAMASWALRSESRIAGTLRPSHAV